MYRMWRERGSRSIFEDTIKVGKFRRILEPEGERTERLLQFWDNDIAPKMGVMTGRLHTIAIKDVVDVS